VVAPGPVGQPLSGEAAACGAVPARVHSRYGRRLAGTAIGGR
jgi:hypothetical protein